MPTPNQLRQQVELPARFQAEGLAGKAGLG